MLWRARLLSLLSATAVLAPPAIAQDPYRPIRFTTADTGGLHHWEGFFEGLTHDSLYVRFRDADSISAFARSAIGSVERQRDIHALRKVGIGCLAVGAPLGALGYFGTHDPDSPGLEKIAGVLGFGVGCAVGGIGGLIVSAVDHNGWERWSLPDSLPSATKRPDNDASSRDTITEQSPSAGEPTLDAALFSLERARGGERLAH
jgi:hypothetical protein